MELLHPACAHLVVDVPYLLLKELELEQPVNTTVIIAMIKMNRTAFFMSIPPINLIALGYKMMLPHEMKLYNFEKYYTPPAFCQPFFIFVAKFNHWFVFRFMRMSNVFAMCISNISVQIKSDASPRETRRAKAYINYSVTPPYPHAAKLSSPRSDRPHPGIWCIRLR